MSLLKGEPHGLRALFVCWLMLAPLLPASLSAKPPDHRPPELEQAIRNATLILVTRVVGVSETKVVEGGKAERVIRTFDFEPVQTLKGIFVRDLLSLTSEDLGDSVWAPEFGQLRLLLLGRTGTGYRNVNRQSTLDRSIPLLDSVDDPLVKTVELLITVTQQHDRGQKIDLLLKGLATAGGAGAVPLLDSLRYRALLAAQHPDVTSIARLLSDPLPEARASAARTLGAILEADYLENGKLAEHVTRALVALLETSDPFVAARVAAIDALGTARSAGEAVRQVAAGQLRLDAHRTTFSEKAAVWRAIGRQRLDSLADPIFALLERMELDAPYDFQEAAVTALLRIDPLRAARLLEHRIRDKHVAGLEAELEIRLAGQLPLEAAVSVLMNVSAGRLSRGERTAFALACQNVKDDRLVPLLRPLLEPRLAEVHWHVVEALREIDTDEAAEALRPYLPQEPNLYRKLQIAELLGRHGIDAGAPYALEHMSQPHLLEPSIAVLVALSGSSQSVKTLKGVMETSHDTAWTGAAIRALGALRHRGLVAQLLGILSDLRHPLAPYALVALGDLGEPQAIETFRIGVRSRDDQIVVASVRGAARLLKLGEVDEESLRDELATLLASADASQEVRQAALDALRDLQDPRLDGALAAAVLDARLEGKPLLTQIEELLQDRKIPLARPSFEPQATP